jgi:hypothetical protein
MNYLGTIFCLLTWEKGFKFSGAIYHFPVVSVFILFAVFRFGGIPKMAAKVEAKIKEKETLKEAKKL